MSLERIEQELGSYVDIIPSPREAVIYAITQFIAFLRETKIYEIPVSTTKEIVETINTVAHDPNMHVKLLNDDWFKTLMKSFIAKDPEQDAIFDAFFTQALEVGAGDIEEIKELKKHNIAMKFFGDELRKTRGMGDFKHDFVAKIPSNKPYSIANVVDDLVKFTTEKGYDPSTINNIISEIPRAKRNRPIQANLPDILVEQMRRDVSMFSDTVQLKEYDSPEQKRIKMQQKFDKDAFNERWMRRVIRKVYGLHDSPHFDAVIDEWLMTQRQKTIESDLSVEDREEATLSPNVLLGAINDFLKELYGDDIPRVYDFPFKKNQINNTIDVSAAADAIAVVTELISIRDLVKNKMGNQYGNLIERTIYRRALKKHLRNYFNGIVTLIPDMTDYELDRYIDAHEKFKQSVDEMLSREDEEEYEDTGSSGLYNLLGAERGRSVTKAYVAKDDKAKLLASTTSFIEGVIKKRSITWKFSTGPNAGKIVTIDSIADYKRYREESRKNVDTAGEKIDDAVHDAMRDVISPGNPKFSRKDMRAMKDLINKIPDKKTRDDLLDMLGDDLDKYDTDIIDEINDLVNGITDKTFKEKIGKTINDVTLPRKKAREIQDRIEKVDAKDLASAFKKEIDDDANFTREEMEELGNLIDEFANRSEKDTIFKKFKDAKISRRSADDLVEKSKAIGDKSLERSIERLFDANRLTGKELSKMDDLLDKSPATVRKNVQKALDGMKYTKSSAKELTDAAMEAGKEIGKKIEDIIGDGKSMSFKDLGDIRDIVSSVKDQGARSKMEKALDRMKFTTKGMNDASKAIDSIDDTRSRNAAKRLLDKKVGAKEAGRINDLVRKIDAIASKESSDAFKDVMDGLEFTAKGFDAIEDSVDDADDKYDTKKGINDLLDGKDVTIPGDRFAGLRDQLGKLAREERDAIDDLIDESRFATDPVNKVKDLLDELPDEGKKKARLKDLMDSITGREVDGKKARKMRDIADDLDPAVGKAMKDILDNADEHAKQSGRDAFADMIKGLREELEDAQASKDGQRVKNLDKGAWGDADDLVKFLKKMEEEIRGGEDPANMFKNIDNDKNINTVIRRLAKTPDAEEFALRFMDSFARMFNKFSEQASEKENKALFGHISSKLDRASKKMEDKIEKIKISKELREEYEKVNEKNRALKEEFNDELASVLERFNDEGIDGVELMRDMFMEEVRAAREGGGIIPQPRMRPVVFAMKPGRQFMSSTVLGAKQERTFLTPKVEDIDVFQETGDDQSHWTFTKFWIKEAADEYISKASEFGSLNSENAVKKLKGEDAPAPDPGSFAPDGSGDPLGQNNPFIDKLNQLKGLTKDDFRRDFFRKIGANLHDMTTPQRAARAMNKPGKYVDPDEELDIEGDIDLPHQRNPYDTSDSPQMTVESKDPLYQRAKRRMQRGAGQRGGGAPTGGRTGKEQMPSGGQMGGAMGGMEAGGEMMPGGAGGQVMPPPRPGETGFRGTGVAQRVEGGVEIPGVEPGTGRLYPDIPDVSIEGVQDFVPIDPMLSMEEEARKTINKFLDEQKIVDNSLFDGIAMDPEEIFDDDAVWDNDTIAEKLKMMVDKPANSAAMKKLFRNKFHSELSKATEQKRGRRVISTIDRHRIFRDNYRNGYNPRTGRMIVTKIPKKTVKPIKRDIFVVDVSGSMYSFLGPVSQLVASLTEPAHLDVILFDTDAVTIDKKIFSRNPAAIFFAPGDFAKKAANEQQRAGKRNRGWEGSGATSYDSANLELENNSLGKGDRVIYIGDLEHNSVLPRNKEMFERMIKRGECKGGDEYYADCTAKWLSTICQKVDSCIAINPKEFISNDITCDLLKYNIPTCFSGATSGNDEKNTVTGSGLKRTVNCIVQGLTGQHPKVDKRVLEACEKGEGFKPIFG